jgi:opacity protein-like surface antigen
MKTRFIAAAAALCLLMAGVATPASAQPFQTPAYKTSGFQLGAYLSGVGASYEESNETDSGGGLTFRLGYGFGKFALYAAGTGASMESGDYTLAHVDLGARYLFTDSRLRPYLQAALTGRASEIGFLGNSIEVRGAGPTLGAGLEYGLGRSAALDLGLNYTFGKYTEARLNNGPWEDLGSEGTQSSTARVDLGVIWRP